MGTAAGPLAGLKVIELRGIGPTPLAGMLLADMGADVIRVDRPSPPDVGAPPNAIDAVHRNKRSIIVDLKHPRGVAVVLDLVAGADVLIEGNRPGVTERLGIGPDACLRRNRALVYGRMTGWGQSGPYAQAAGHDLNYIAINGVLDGIGLPGQPPLPPLSYIGDFGGGTMFLLFGVLCALNEARRSGRGQVVDAAMVDGAAVLATQYFALLAAGMWQTGRGQNILDGSAPHYASYECADGGCVTIAANEPQFYAALREALGLTGPLWDEQADRSRWPERKKTLTALFRTRTRDEWCIVLERHDTCFAPVLSMLEAPAHSHIRDRATLVEEFGVLQPAPAPRLSQTPGSVRRPPPEPGEHTREVLAGAGLDAAAVNDLVAMGAVGAPTAGG